MTREDFKIVKLGDICEFQYGYTASSTKEVIGPKLLRITDIVPDLIDWHSVPYCIIEENKYAIFSIKKGDILVARTGATVGYAKQIKDDIYGVFASYLIRIRLKDEYKSLIDNQYLGIIIQSSYFKKFIKESSTGSAQPHANAPILKEFELPLLPPLHEQQRISSILSIYDDLIENSSRRISLLEQMAQTLYRQGFVEYKFLGYQDVEMVESGTEFGVIPQGWEVKKIGDEIAKIKRAKKVQSKEYLSEGSIPIIDQSRGYIAGYTEDEMYLQTSPLPIVVFGDHTRIVKYIPFPFASGADGTQLMYPKNEKMLPNYFYLAILQIEVPNYHYERHYKFLQDKYIIIPSDYILDQFHIKTIPIFDEILNLQEKNQSLKEQTDILLRKLIG